MGFFDAVLLGIVEGLTEFLPISSTGHLILSAKLLGIPADGFTTSFAIAIQLGAILAVAVLYWRMLLTDRAVMLRVAAAFIPTALAGAALYTLAKTVLLESTGLVLWSLFVGGILLMLFERWHREKEGASEIAHMSYRQAVLIGLAQSVAMIPGVSRAAATILGGLALGIKRRAIVEFSFLLAVPTMAAATALDLYKSAGEFSSSQFDLLAVGFVVSFVVALAAVKFLLRFIKTHDFTAFGVYRIAVAVLFWFLVL